MSVPFISTNSTTTIAYTTNAGHTQLIAAPQILNIVNPDMANVVIVNASVANVAANLVTGAGTVVGPASTAQLKFNTLGATGPFYISVIGKSPAGNVYLSTGSI